MSSFNATGLLKYMKTRDMVRVRKEAGLPWPWCEDPIIQQYKFTNVRRKHDRTTKELREIYERHVVGSTPYATLYNCSLYRYFGTSEFARAVGWLPRHDGRRIAMVARKMMAEGKHAFTGAYIVTNCGEVGSKEVVVGSFLKGLWEASRDIVAAFFDLNSWKAAYSEMVRVHGFGGKGFYAKEALLDFMLCYPGRVKDELTWTPVGPGARRGLNRILGRPLKFHQSEVKFIDEVQVLREELRNAWAAYAVEPLSAHDVQWNLCEFDKYERVRLGEGRPRSRYHVRAST